LADEDEWIPSISSSRREFSSSHSKLPYTANGWNDVLDPGSSHAGSGFWRLSHASMVMNVRTVTALFAA